MKISKHFVRFNEFYFLYARQYDFCVMCGLLEVPRNVQVYLCSSYGSFILKSDCSDWGRLLNLNLKRYDSVFIKGMQRKYPEIVE